MKQSSIVIRVDSKKRKKVFRKEGNKLLGVITGNVFKTSEKSQILTCDNLLDIVSVIKIGQDTNDIRELGGHIVGNIAKWMMDYFVEITNSNISVTISDDKQTIFMSVTVLLKRSVDLSLFCLEFKKDTPTEVEVDFFDIIPAKTINTVFEGIFLINKLIQTETLCSSIPACSLLKF